MRCLLSVFMMSRPAGDGNPSTYAAVETGSIIVIILFLLLLLPMLSDLS